MEFTELALLKGSRITRVTMSQGTAIVSAKLSRGEAMSVAASNLNVKVPDSGRFRVDVSPTDSWVTVFHGKVEVDSGSEAALVLGGGHTLHENASGSASPEIAGSPAPDAFDKWVSQREQAVNYSRQGTSEFLNSTNYTEGFADLYNFGLWSNVPGFGMGWMPYGVGAGWMPFVSGQWLFMDYTGWNWVSSEPWGWMPYHFGSWINAPGLGWVWLPGGSYWQPSTATWVQVNNQLGWIPKAPLLPPKPTKGQAVPAPTTVILATQGASGAITAGGRMALTQGTTAMQVASAPAPVSLGVQGIARSTTTTTGSANASAFMRPGPVSQARISSGPAPLRAPGGAAAQARSAPLSSAPPSLTAPHSMPAPRLIAGASGGFRGGSGGTRGGGNGGGGVVSTGSSAPAPASVSTHGTGMSSASHSSGGSAGSSTGHR
jgi:hypothetical protein